jgi:hypothetical protein
LNPKKVIDSINKFFESNRFSGILIGIITFTIIIPFSFTDAYNKFELTLYDLRFKIKPSIEQWDKLYFINIDDNSTTALGQFPWTRDIYSTGLQTMRELGLSQICFDVMFPDPSPKQINEGIYKNLVDMAAAKKVIPETEILAVLKDNDIIFSDGLKYNGTAILSYTFSEDKPTPDIIERQNTRDFINSKKRFESIASIPVPQGREKEFEALSDPETSAIVFPITEMLSTAKNFGFVNRFTDIDGTIRKVRLVQV